MDQKRNIGQVLREALVEPYLEAGIEERKAIRELRKFRVQISLGAITLVTVVTPFAKDYVSFTKFFGIAYAFLSLSAIVGLIGMEGILRSDIQYFSWFQSYLQEIRNELKISEDAKGAMQKLEKGRNEAIRDDTCSFLSRVSIYFFIIGLVLLFISVFPIGSH